MGVFILIQKRIFVFSFFLILLFSTVFSATVTDNSTTIADTQNNAQSFAQINATITQLSNQIALMRSQDQNFQASVFMKSDLQGLYDNLVNINKQTEQQIILDNMIIVVMAFALMFILIGKNLIPQNKKEPKDDKKPKKDVKEEELIIVPQNTGGI